MATFTPSQQDIESYEALKPELLRQLRKGKIFRSQDCPGHVGLMNQGATCYLNSLLQTLFHIPAFRNFIIKHDSTAKITSALRKLFASLVLSDDCAIGTKEITTAFGWSNSEVFEQHDIQELFCSMTDALCQESSEIDSFLTDNFKGTLTDSLECPSCGFKKQSSVSFQDVPLNLSASSSGSSNSGVSLTELMQNFCAEEVLDSNNLWTCGKCSEKVPARKSSHFDSLPSTLFLHLKRFGYDQNTQQRRKISSPVYFPLQTTEAELRSGGNPDKKYRLRSVLIHLGTASGGHYKTYVQAKPGQWFEFDDANVLELSEEEQHKLFWCTSPSASAASQVAEAATEEGSNSLLMRGFSIYEGAYMLVYQLDDAAASAAEEEATATALAIPTELSAEVRAANEQLAMMRKANEVHKLMTELRCFKLKADVGSHVKPSNAVTLTPVTCHLIGLKSLNEALAMIYDAFVKSGVIDPSKVDRDTMCRLRRYNPSSAMVGETFTSREALSLTELGLSPLSCLAMEVLSPGDTFTDFNPKEVEVRLIQWNPNGQPAAVTAGGGAAAAAADVFVSVVGEENATVAGLRSRVAQFFGITEENRILLAKSDTKSSSAFLELSEDASLLTSGYGVHSGDDVMVSVLPEGQSRHEEGKGGEFTAALQAQKRNITLFFNSLPSSGLSTEAVCVEYEQCVVVSLDATLGDLKRLIGKTLGLKEEEESSFFFRRNANAPQLKKLNKSLEEIGFVDQGIVHVQRGQQIAPGEHTVQCELDLTSDDNDWKQTTPQSSASSVLVGELVVKEKMTCLQLKELLLSQWTSVVGAVCPAPPSPQHIRIRDGQTGGQSGPLRDTRILGRSLVGLGDGRKLIIQCLSEPEVLTPENLFLTLRIMSFQDKLISRPLSLTVARSLTVRQFYRLVLDKYAGLDEATSAPLADGDATSDSGNDLMSQFPECRLISIAKAYNSGPPLTMKSSLKLKWNDEMVLREPDTALDKPPLGLRDGSVLVIRNVADFERARDAARARVAERPSSSVGGVSGDSPARGRIRPNSRARSRGGRRVEKGISIAVESKEDAPPPPEPTPTKDQSAIGLDARFGTGGLVHSPRMDITDENATDGKNGLTLPNAPVRIVKALRSPRPGDEQEQAT